MGAADFDDVPPSGSFVVQRFEQVLKRRQQIMFESFNRAHVHRRRKRIVGRLAAVAIVVGMNGRLRAHLAAEHLDGAVGDDFIGIHVGLGARPRLPDNQRKVVVEFAVDHLLGGGGDRFADFRVDAAQFDICKRRGFFDDTQSPDHRRRHRLAADFEVSERTLCLSAPIFVRRHLYGAEGIGFCSRRHIRLLIRIRKIDVPVSSFFSKGFQTDHISLLFRRGIFVCRLQRLIDALERQDEFDAWIREIQNGAERYAKMFADIVECQIDFEGVVVNGQIPESVLENDGHIRRKFPAKSVGQFDAPSRRQKRNEKVMPFRQPALRGSLKGLANDAAKCAHHHRAIVHVVRRHGGFLNA